MAASSEIFMPDIVTLAWISRPLPSSLSRAARLRQPDRPDPSAQKIIGLNGARSHDMAVPSRASEPGVSSAM
jgi:hypothetical protein